VQEEQVPKHKFSPFERHAIYTVHGEKCYLCGALIDMKTMEVDHILPERLCDTPTELRRVLGLYGKPDTFDLNSYANWLPACGPCNLKKRATVFEPVPIIQDCLQQAAAKSQLATEIAAKAVLKKEVTRALNLLERADATGQLDEALKAKLRPLVAFQREVREPAVKNDPVRLLPLYEVLQDDGRTQVVRGPYGIGARPSPSTGDDILSDCPSCGVGAAFNGVRCVRCGAMDD
jgi:hypothetical protein